MGAVENFDPFEVFNLFGGGGSGSITTNMTELAAAGSQYYMIPSVTLAGDFEIEVEFATTDASSSFYLIDSDADLKLKIIRHSDGFIHYLAGDGSAWVCNMTGTTTVHDGKLHKAKFTKVGNVYTGYIDGVLDVTSSNPGAIAGNVTYIGARANLNQLFNGIIRNVKIWDNGTLIRHYKIDETWDSDLVLKDSSGNGQDGQAINITQDDAEEYTFKTADNAWLGQELVVNGGFDTDTDWSKGAGWVISNGVASSVSAESYSTLRQSGALVAGGRYRTIVETVSSDAGVLRLQDGLGGIAADISSVGLHIEEYVSAGDRVSVTSSSAGFIGSIDNISSKRLIEVA